MPVVLSGPPSPKGKARGLLEAAKEPGIDLNSHRAISELSRERAWPCVCKYVTCVCYVLVCVCINSYIYINVQMKNRAQGLSMAIGHRVPSREATALSTWGCRH